MEDEELTELRNSKVKLLQRAMDLIVQLRKHEENKQQSTLNIPSIIDNINNKENRLLGESERILCKVAQQVTGITFKDIDRTWLKDNLYCYTTKLTTKTLTSIVELTLELQGEKEFEIFDITCHFLDIDRCYMLEIESWVQTTTKMKNFSLLASAISQYNNQNLLRAKILHQLKNRRYGTSKQCTEKNGGFLIHIHSTDNVQKVYLEFQWSLLFVERTWQIEHFFKIVPTEIGIEFGRQHQKLLQEFCKIHLDKETLVYLWNRLFSAIDVYEGKAESDVNSSGA